MKSQPEVLLREENMKTKVMLKCLCVLCAVFCFFTSQLFASFDVANCRQRKEKLNEEYTNNIGRVDKEYTAKLQEIIINRKEKGPQLHCEACKDGSICCDFSIKEREELEELESLRNLFGTFYKQELEDINWACKNHE